MSLSVTVRKTLGSFTLDVAFEAEGGVTALFGRSGSGKTTLVNLIAGLERPDSGRIVLNGKVLADAAQHRFMTPPRRRIGYVFQEGRLFPHLSVRSNLLYGRWLAPRERRWGSLEETVELLGIGGLLGRRPRDLSGGEKQRVAIGRALLASPDCLLMDEPLAALDRERKNEILPYLERLNAERRLPILYVSHSVEEVARLADRVVRLQAGRVVAAGPVGEVFASPGAGDLGVGAVLTATVMEPDSGGLGRVRHPAGDIVVPGLTAPRGSAVRLRIRSRDITLAVGEIGRISIRNRLRARVKTVSAAAGGDMEVQLDVGGEPMLARVTADAVRDLQLEPGDAVTVLIKAVALQDGLGD